MGKTHTDMSVVMQFINTNSLELLVKIKIKQWHTKKSEACYKHIERGHCPASSFEAVGCLTHRVCVDVPQLIVQIEETLHTLLDGGDGSITSQDKFVEL